MAEDDAVQRITVLLQARDRDLQRAVERNNKLISKFSDDANKKLRGTGDEAQKLDARLRTATTGAVSFGRAFAGGLAIGAATTVLTMATSQLQATAQSIAQVGDEAKRSGLSASEFQQWAYVAQKNRIGIDSFVDGFKELSLRADEFISTGAGPAEEAFLRLGYSASDLQEKLKNPSELMLEIIGRMEKMDKAAQIRIADELFGGTGGERFVELLAQGEAGLRRTKDEAVAMGVVMSDDLIAKAAELDSMFTTVASTVGVALRSAIVSAAYALADFIDGFREFENQRSSTLETRRGEIEEELAERRARREANTAKNGTVMNRGGGQDAQRIRDLEAELATVNAELATRAVPEYTPTDPGWTPPTPPEGGFGGSGGGDKGGKSKDKDEYADAAERIRERTAERLNEAAALEALAQSARDLADAEEYARITAELLHAVQKEGKQITPELRAEIDALAAAYITAGEKADEAADRMNRVKHNAERGAQAIGDIFGSVIDGSASAEDAMKRLIGRIAEVQAEKALMGMAGGGGWIGGGLSWLGGMLSGQRAVGGSVNAGQAYRVNENTPRSEIFVPSRSGAILTVPQAQAAMRPAGGGGGSTTIRRQTSISLTTDLRGTTGDRELDARIQRSQEALLEQLPSYLQEHDLRN